MRFIDRNAMTPPKLLFSKRAEQARGEVEQFLSMTQQKGGTRRVPDCSWMLRDTQFREDVAKGFRAVCAYCETKASTEFKPRGLASHHRPTSLAEDEDGNTVLTAYSWLTYEWENILWVCDTCSRLKGNKFFIDEKRAGPGDDIAQARLSEKELLLDPTFHTPSIHLDFLINGFINWKTPLGHATVETLRLNRPELLSGRRAQVEKLLTAFQTDLDRVEYLVTGAKEAEDTAVLWVDRSMEAPNKGIRGQPHLGGTTLAILAHAKANGISASNAPTLIAEFKALDPSARAAFLQNAVEEAQRVAPFIPPPDNPSGRPRFKFNKSQSTSSSAQPSERTPRKPSRIPNIHSLPAAESPVTAVNISNFKALTSIAFDLPSVVEDIEQSPCMILLGENATGKSTVLEAMALAILGTGEAGKLNDLLKDEDLSPDDLIHRPDTTVPEKTAASMSVDLVFLDGLQRTSLYAEAGDERFSGDERTSKIVLGYGPRRFFTKRKSRRLRAPAHRVRSLFDPMAMIANPIHWLSGLDDQHFYAAARALREVLLLEDDDDFERDAGDKEGGIYITHHGQRTALGDMSVGYKSVIAMACDIIRELLYHYDNLEFAYGVVFVDEIETHLHPRWKMQIMQLLRKAFPKVQFIVTTHDPLCLRGMYDGEVFVLQRTDAGNTVEKIDDLPSIRGMRAEQILTSEFFGLGSTDPKTDAILIHFNWLLERHESLNKDELQELERLGQVLDRDLVLGSSIAQQAHSAALKKRTQQTVSPTKVATPRRKDIEATFPVLFDVPGGEIET